MVDIRFDYHNNSLNYTFFSVTSIFYFKIVLKKQDVRGDIWIPMAASCWGMAETNTILKGNYPSIKNTYIKKNAGCKGIWVKCHLCRQREEIWKICLFFKNVTNVRINQKLMKLFYQGGRNKRGERTFWIWLLSFSFYFEMMASPTWWTWVWVSSGSWW